MVILGEQMTLEGLAPRKRRSSAQQKVPAGSLPFAQVVIDVQAAHLGQTFDYLVEESQSDRAQPGALVRVRFGGRLLNGIIWNRSDTSTAPRSSLRFLERVMGSSILVPAQMRQDISDIADFFGGTRANIIRLAVPPRVAHVDKEPRFGRSSARPGRQSGFSAGSRAGYPFSQETLQAYQNQTERIRKLYQHSDALNRAWEQSAVNSLVWDCLPGVNTWADDLSWVIMKSLESDRPIVVELPDAAHIRQLHQRLQACGLKAYAQRSARGVWQGDYCILAGMMTPEERYRSYMALARSEVTCVIGTRAAMYAPVEGRAVFVVVDDCAYQNADGFTPYANARDVLRLRARNHQGTFIALGHVRSPYSQWELEGRPTAIDCGKVLEVRGLPTETKRMTPWVRLFNRQELENLTDPTIGARVPHTAVSIINNALKVGPVLLCVPHDGQSMTLICSSCHRQARCRRCAGPLKQSLTQGQAPRCLWCGFAATEWTCPHCGGEKMRVIQVGALGTAQELCGLFPHTRIVTSTPHQPRGIVTQIEDRPQVVIATPGAEPQIISTGLTRMEHREGLRVQQTYQGPHHPSAACYQAVVILDTWTSLYASQLDSRIDILTAWMRAASLCASHEDGGQVLLLGECEPAIAHSLMTWDSSFLSARETADRQETDMPPAITVANVWGRREVIDDLLSEIGVESDGDWGFLPDGMPAVLGPISIPPPSTVKDRQLEGSNDRVRAAVRVPVAKTRQLAQRLHLAAARHATSRLKGELKFQINPKSLS